MKAYKPTGRNWEWAHRRNRTLLQANLFSDGLEGEGYFQAVRFNRADYLGVFVAGEGEYFFYDKAELVKNTKAFQEDIDSGRCTRQKLRELSTKFFGRVMKAAKQFTNRDLAKLSNAELLELFKEFRAAMTIGPIITVQLWGIESCWDPSYKLMKFLEKRLPEIGENGKIFEYHEILSATSEKMVPLQEREEFLEICAEIEKNHLQNKLQALPKEINQKINSHLAKWAWMTSEYKSEPWSREKWLEKFKHELQGDCARALKELRENHETAVEKKRAAIIRLKPPAEVIRVLDCLEEFLLQRDWSKGKYSEAFLHWQPLLAELAGRINCTKEEVGLHTLDEIEEFFAAETKIPPMEMQRRQKKFVVISLGKPFEVYSKNIDAMLQSEGVAAMFKAGEAAEVNGTVASKGKAVGIARVVMKPSEKDLVQKGEILVTYMTTVEFTPVFAKIAGLVTDEGGISSHAAIVSREFGIPCIIGTKNATRVFKTGDKIEVDATNGVARKL